MIRRRLALIAVGFLIAGASSPGGHEQVSWHHFRPHDGSFSVDFPAGDPIMFKEGPGSKRQRYTTFLSEDRGQFMVEVWTDPKYTIQRAAEELRDYPNPGAAGINGKVVEARNLKAGRYPGREVLMKGTGGPPAKPLQITQRSRAYVGEGRLYVVIVDATGGRPIPPEADHFFESFAIP
jgi:hypothetical protein